jgi:hypothetical protein
MFFVLTFIFVWFFSSSVLILSFLLTWADKRTIKPICITNWHKERNELKEIREEAKREKWIQKWKMKTKEGRKRLWEISIWNERKNVTTELNRKHYKALSILLIALAAASSQREVILIPLNSMTSNYWPVLKFTSMNCTWKLLQCCSITLSLAFGDFS